MTPSRRLPALSLFLILAVSLILASTALARPTSEEQVLIQDMAFVPSLGTLDANNLGIRPSNLGLIMYGLPPGGLEYPLGSGNPLVYGAGIWVGARVEDEIRVVTGWYTYEFGPGPIFEDGTWADASDPIYKVYKIVRGDTTSEDYLSWPSDQGAPLNQQGNPRIIGEQTLWCVYNDADSSLHNSEAGGTAPLGIEIQQTMYAFDTDGAFADVAIAELKIINKLGNMLDSAYVSIWSDPDIGSATNDLVGCDTTLDVGFGYNGSDFDDLYGMSSPCVGFDFLKGPENVAGEVLGMTAFSKHGALYDPVTYLETYNLMRGLQKDGAQVTNPVSGEITRYKVPGDPVAGTGWLDLPPADKRMVMSAGPFTMAPGDTQTVVIGIVVGHGADRFESIELMKANDRILQASFNNGFKWPWKPEFDARAGHDADAGRRLPETSEATPSEGGGLIIGSASEDRGWNVSVGPNPGRGMVTVRCHVPSPGHAEVKVFDTSGRVVHRAAIEGDPSGVSEWTWHGMTYDGEEMPPGIYFIRVRSGSRAETAKVILLR